MTDIDLPCPNCRRTNRAAASFCVRCGALLVPTPCPACGGRAEPGDRYCQLCGGFLRARKERPSRRAANGAAAGLRP